MPTWLFWAIASASQKEKTLEFMGIHEAVGAAGQGFTEDGRKKVWRKWEKTLDHGKQVEPELSEQVGMSIEERRKRWLGIAS